MLIAALALLLGAAARADFLGRGALPVDPGTGRPTPQQPGFGTRQDEGADNGRITLAADPVTDKRLAGYRVHYGTETGVYTNVHDCRKTLETGCTVSGLTNGVTYYFAATAYALGRTLESTYSNEVSGQP